MVLISRMDRPQNIEMIRRQFQNEWLLISVDEVDQQTTTPLNGVLIAHGPSPDALWEKARKLGGTTMVVYSDDWPDDLAACF